MSGAVTQHAADRAVVEPEIPCLHSDLTAHVSIVERPTSSNAAARLHRFVGSAVRALGVDRAIAYTLLGRGWSVIAGPVTLLLIVRYLRPEEQGFYYTFYSVIALNIFFELGLTYVLVQFASHEKAHLEWTGAGTLSGSEVAHARLAALLKLALRWYAAAALLVMLLLLPGGLVFFSRNSSMAAGIVWRAPWVWLAVVSALNLLTMPLLAVLEGCGKVSHIASMRAGQNIASSIGLWLTLPLHGALFAVPVMETINAGYAALWVGVGYAGFLKTLLRMDVSGATLKWATEVWPFQWRIAVSWLSGYFIFQLFNPVLFATHGAVVAGQMGMSIVICNSLLSVSMAWMSTKASPFGVMVARQQWAALDELFFKTFRQSLLVLVAGGLVGYACVVALKYYNHPFSKRWLSPLPFAFLLLAVMLNHVLFCEAQYLRAHKSEPFLWLSVALGVLVAVSTFVIAKPFGALGVSAGYFTCCGAALIAGTRVFLRKRREWHA